MSKSEKKRAAPKKKETSKKKKEGAPKKKRASKKDESPELVQTEEELAEPAAPTRLETETAEEETLETPAVEAEEKEEAVKPEEEAPVEAPLEAPEVPIEEEKPAEEEEEGLEIVEEKFYDLNLRRIWNTPRLKRTPRAVRFVREFVSKRMKSDEVSISEETNQLLWARGISKPPRHLRLRVVKDKDDRVIIFPAETVAAPRGPGEKVAGEGVEAPKPKTG